MMDDTGDNGTDPMLVHYHSAEEGSLTESVLEAVAAVEEVSPAELEALTSRIDPDALDAIFSPRLDGTPRLEGTVQFPLHGNLVTVYATGEILVQSGSRRQHTTSAQF